MEWIEDSPNGRELKQFKHDTKERKRQYREEMKNDYQQVPYALQDGYKGRMTMDEYNSIKDGKDAQALGKRYGYERPWLFSSNEPTPKTKEDYELLKQAKEEYGTNQGYGDWWAYYPKDIQQKMVQLMHYNNAIGDNGLSFGNDFDGTDLETNARIQALAYPKNADYWNRYGDLVSDNIYRRDLHIPEVERDVFHYPYNLQDIAKRYPSSNAYFGSDEFKDRVYNNEMIRPSLELDMRAEQNAVAQDAYRQKLEDEAKMRALQEDFANAYIYPPSSDELQEARAVVSPEYAELLERYGE